MDLDQLKKLHELKEQRIISEEEYLAKKEEILNIKKLKMCSFPLAVKTFFAKYIDFNGRATRSEYWWIPLFTTMVSIVLAVISGLCGLTESSTNRVIDIWTVIILLPSMSLGVRRLHDVNKSGWWILLSFTIIGLIPLLIWNIKPSDLLTNKYGEVRQF